MKNSLRILVAALVVAATPSVVFSQFLVESCGDLVPPTFSFPFEGSFTPAEDDFNLQGACGNADTSGVNDFVVCFVPQNDCELTGAAAYVVPGPEAPTLMGAVARGVCAATPPGPCVSQTGTDLLFLDVNLTAGDEVCVIIEALRDAREVTLVLDGEGCGSLPVELQSISVTR